ncbi:MAG: class I SAM-dependent methyltransferase [Anaerolineae bacterium]|nr:class I SAM-dependent methyltransferase [Anaerolineae bacterium]
MFHTIPKSIQDRMSSLEKADTKDRAGSTPQLQRLRQVPPETGKFLALTAANAPEGAWLEIGTSGGYSALWISLACQKRATKLVTFELLPEKVELARESFKKAKVEALVELVHGDARGHISDYDEIAFCFLDAEKEMYAEFYELVVPRLVKGGILIADNFLSHKEDLQSVLEQAEADESVDSLMVPIGKGLLLCRKQ